MIDCWIGSQEILFSLSEDKDKVLNSLYKISLIAKSITFVYYKDNDMADNDEDATDVAVRGSSSDLFTVLDLMQSDFTLRVGA